MALLDRYLHPLTEKRADELHLYAGVSPTYLLNQTPIRELDKIFSNEEILHLLSEILQENDLQELESKRRLNYLYHTPIGSFRCQLRWSGEELKTRFTLQPENTTHSSSHNTLQQISGAHNTYSQASTAAHSAVGHPGPSPSSDSLSSQSHHSLASVARVHPRDSLRNTQERAIIRALSRKGDKEIDQLFRVLRKERGSDLHLSSAEKPIIRVDGKLRRLDNLPELQAEQIAQLIAPIIPERNRIQFIKTWDTDFAYEVEEVGRFRANIFMDRNGIGAVFRLIPSQVLTAQQLNLSKAITDLCSLSKGLVLVTGPTGSGKSTTLGALIDLINRTRDEHIITIEDPIEFVHENKRCLINQREVNVHTDSFKTALRAALREDPDVVLVGEMRDLETISIAIETAETGHLVFATLHTTSAMTTIDRMIDQFPAERQEQIRMMLSNSLKAVISQTLLRKKGGGRIAAMEVLIVTHSVSNLIRERKIHQIPTVLQTNRAIGMRSLNDVLVDYTRRGLVEVREAYLKAIDKTRFIELAKEADIPTDSLLSLKGIQAQIIS